jgi:hypothetical protein
MESREYTSRLTSTQMSRASDVPIERLDYATALSAMRTLDDRPAPVKANRHGDSNRVEIR